MLRLWPSPRGKPTSPALAVFLTVGPGPTVRDALVEIFSAMRSSGLLHAASRIGVNAHDYERTAPADARTWRQLLPPDLAVNVTALTRSIVDLAPRRKHEDRARNATAPPPPTYEFPTLVALRQHCMRHPMGLAFYLHTKGSTYARKDRYQKDRYQDRVDVSSHATWRRNMIHYTVRRYRDCVQHLTCGGYSACGASLNHERDGRPGSWLRQQRRCEKTAREAWGRAESITDTASALARIRGWPRWRHRSSGAQDGCCHQRM